MAKSSRSVLREQAQDVHARARGKPVYYTEWNTSSNPRDPLHDEPYAAAFVVKTVLEMSGLVDGSHATVDAWVVCKNHSVTVLCTNHALPRHPICTEHVHVRLTGAREPCCAYVERIDEVHANPKRLWRELGEPEYLSAQQVEQLQEASRVRREPYPWRYQDRVIHLDVALPPHAVAAITLELAPDHPEGADRA